ncbi:MAG TPA: (2Fe-2S)-binding protein [Sphingobium sp.]|uniref:(2Fe-2S)-binding protein n=1 Tax=Sphingobium sp. TaxID=1912891 RepID=UPI002ED1E99E
MTARFVRLAETDRVPVHFHVDGVPVSALAGDTVMVAMLTNGGRLRQSEFGDGARSGFCLMAACQDCWVWTEEGTKLRACSTPVTEGLRIITTEPEATWPNQQ